MVSVGQISETLRRPLVASFFGGRWVSSTPIAPRREDMGGGYLYGPALETFTGGPALGYDQGYGGEVFYLGLALARRTLRDSLRCVVPAAPKTADQADHHPF